MGELKKAIGEYVGQFQLASNELTISLRRQKDDFLLTTTISDNNLPQSFHNIFDNVAELFQFIKNDNKIEVHEQVLTIAVTIIKIRYIKISLNKMPLPKINLVEEKIERIQARTAKLQHYFHQSLPKFCQKLFQDWSKKTIKTLASQVKRLNQKVATLQQIAKKTSTNNISPSLFKKVGSNIASPGQQETRIKTNKQGQNPFLIQYQPKTNGPLGKLMQRSSKVIDFGFDVDLNNKFIQYFSIDNSTITRIKEDEELYMLSSSNYIPENDRHSIKIKINKISDGLIWIGLIVPKKKSQQYIGEEKEIIQFSLQGNKSIVDGKIYDLSFSQFKNGDTIEMLVQIGLRKIQFIKNGRPAPFYEIGIPQSMRGVPLYPYVQMISQGDSITFF